MFRHSLQGGVCIAASASESVASIKFRLRALRPEMRLSAYGFWDGMVNIGDGNYRGCPVGNDAQAIVSLRSNKYTRDELAETGTLVITDAMVNSEPEGTVFLITASIQKPLPLPVLGGGGSLTKKTQKQRRRKPESLTRLETVKQLFAAFINRSIAYNYPQQIGGLVFSNKESIKMVCPITPRYETFRQAIDTIGVNSASRSQALASFSPSTPPDMCSAASSSH
jgi:hypothetical protein